MSDEEDEIDLKIRFDGEVHKLFDVPVGLSNRELLIQIITEICPQQLSKIPKLKLGNEREISFAKPKFNLRKYIRRFGAGEGAVRGVLEFGEKKNTEKESKKKEGKIQELEKAKENLEKELDEKNAEVKNLKKTFQKELDEKKDEVKGLKKMLGMENNKVKELEEQLKHKDLRLKKLLKYKAESEKVSVLAAKLKKRELAFAEPLFEKHPILLEALALCSAFYFVKKHAAEFFSKFNVSQVPLWRICTFCCEVRRRSINGSKDNNPKHSNRCQSTSCHKFCCLCLWTKMEHDNRYKYGWKCLKGGNWFIACEPILIPQEFRRFPSKQDPENCVFPTQTYENSSYWFKGDRAKLLLERKREWKVSSLIERRVPVDKWDGYLSDCDIKLSFSSLAERLEKGCSSSKTTFIIIDPLSGGVTCFDEEVDISKEKFLRIVGKKNGQPDPRKVFLLSTEGMVCLEKNDVRHVEALQYGKNIVPLIRCEFHTD